MAGKKPPKFVFECQRCGRCCEEREVEVCIEDLRRWSEDGSMYSAYPHLELKIGEGGVATGIRMEQGGCPLFDKEEKECAIYASRPASCAAFPLAFNGEKYLVLDKDCKGLRKGKMSAEGLAEMREAARELYEGRVEMLKLIPLVQGLLVKHLAEESKREMDKLPEEERKKIEELFRKAKDGEAV